MVEDMDGHTPTRQEELIRVLNQLAQDLTSPKWIALVDDQGFIVACVPTIPPVDPETISAMAVVVLGTAERVLAEIDGGSFRYLNLAGSESQNLIILLKKDRLLSIGLLPEVHPQSTFGPVLRWIPEISKVLNRRFKTS
jgi:predicted regulator of Ras-like GTPase activity (Roadblock/LC7/MglB family)